MSGPLPGGLGHSLGVWASSLGSGLAPFPNGADRGSPMDGAVLSSALVLGRNVRLCLQDVNSVLLSGIICKKQMFGLERVFRESRTVRAPRWLSKARCAAGIWMGPRPLT